MLKRNNLHNYQEAGVTHIIDVPKSGLFLDMGLGKTVTTLTATNSLMYEELDVMNALVIGPRRVVESVWKQEAEKWKHLKHLTFSRIIGNVKQRKVAITEKADIHLISRDNIAWLCGQYGGSMLPWDMLIIDESSSFKNHKSQRFKALRKVIPSFSRVVILTGTPAPNSLLDLWSQIYLLDRGERLEKFITRYRQRFFSRDYNGFSYSLNKNVEGVIYDKISDIVISMKAEDYLELPERIDNYIDVSFDAALRKKYTDFERESVLQLLEEADNENDITAANAAALSNKLLQFSNGAVYDADKNAHTMHDLKIEACKELVEAAQGKPVLIAWTFRHDLKRLLVALKAHKPQTLKNDQTVKDWNEGKIKVLLMHPASGGHGLNLQDGGSTVIWFGLNWSLELYQQFNARLHRQGQKQATVVNHILVKDTIDEDVKAALARKENTQNSLMTAVKARIKKYYKK